MSQVLLPPGRHEHVLPIPDNYPPGSLTKCVACTAWFHLVDLPMVGPHWQPLSWGQWRLRRRIKAATTPRPMNPGANLINQDIPEGFSPPSMSLDEPEYDYVKKDQS